MLGVIFYGGLAYGLGLIVPGRRSDDGAVAGLRFVVGISFLLIALYVFGVLLSLSMRNTVAVAAALAACGWIRAARGPKAASRLDAIAHPALVLPLLGLVVVLANGGVGYVPYLIDEFTNWIGVSRLIHWAGSYDAIRETVHLPGYTPGWRLLLAAPWQVTGHIDLGLSAAAPFVLHVAVLALIYDMVVLVLRRDAELPAARLYGWLALLLLLASEAMGRLWTYEMLTEQPQIYLLSAAGLLLLRAELVPTARLVSYCAAGFVLAAGFLLKNAIAAAAPGAALVALLPLFERRRPLRERLQESLIVAAALLAPLLAAMASGTRSRRQTAALPLRLRFSPAAFRRNTIRSIWRGASASPSLPMSPPTSCP